MPPPLPPAPVLKQIRHNEGQMASHPHRDRVALVLKTEGVPTAREIN